jgi:small-conductance mechanosensitive channel
MAVKIMILVFVVVMMVAIAACVMNYYGTAKAQITSVLSPSYCISLVNLLVFDAASNKNEIDFSV